MQARALADVAAALGLKTGELEQAASVAGQAETAARSITIPARRAGSWALARVAAASLVPGERLSRPPRSGQAETAARSITDPYGRRTLRRMSPRRWPHRWHPQAAEIARMVKIPTARRAPWRMSPRRWPSTGNLSRPSQLPGQSPIPRGAPALASVAAALAKYGEPEQAIAVARSITKPSAQASALANVAAALAKYGKPEQAIALARSITAPGTAGAWAGQAAIAATLSQNRKKSDPEDDLPQMSAHPGSGQSQCD